jgi:GT2 family glycosyltransferase
MHKDEGSRMTRVGVVTVTFNSAQVLQPFLDCVLAQRDIGFELLIVDNASADGTRQILGGIRDSRVKSLLNDANLGFAKASNQGIAHFLERGFDRVLLINNDTEFPAKLFADLDGLLQKHRGRVITPRITYFDRPELNWYCGGRFTPLRGMTGYHERAGLPDAEERAEVRAVEYAPACCLMVDRSVFEEVGLLDERFFVYWEDGDFCMRLKRAHVPLLYAPGIVLAHKASSLTGGQTSDFTIRQYHKNQMYFVRKHFGPVMLTYTFVVMILKSLLRVLFRGDTWRQFRLRMRAMADGLRPTVP